MQKLYSKSKNASLCSNMSADSEILKEESKESLKQEGEQLLSDYRKQYALEIFDKNIFKTFENMFEAGYLFKFYNVVWQENKTPTEEDNSEKFYTENQSYKNRGKSFQLTARTTPEATADASPKKKGCC